MPIENGKFWWNGGAGGVVAQWERGQSGCSIILAEVVVDGADGDGVAVVGYVGVFMVGEQEEVVAAGFPGGEEEACDFPFAGFVFWMS